MKKIAFCLVLFFCNTNFVTPIWAASPNSIPNARLSVTVQQKEDGEIEKGFHVLVLSCWDENCSLSSVSLNSCNKLLGEEAFNLKVQNSSTWMNNLKVSKVSSIENSLVVQETGSDFGGDYIVSLRFDYAPAEKNRYVPELNGYVTKLIGFSGGFLKNSDILKKAIVVEYVPLSKDFTIIKLDCAVGLPGVDKE